MARDNQHIIEHLFRNEYGKLVATLTRIFGSAHIQLAEDIVQDTLIAALDHWSVDNIPDQPTAWLIQVAKRKALNELKRHQMMQRHHQLNDFRKDSSDEISSVFLEDEIEDSQLRMIFTCCHPSIPVSAQIALILKTLCGFGVKQVAKALLSTASTINKKLYRAKVSIRESNLPFSIPQGKSLDSRLEAVSLALYLLFNEGYNSTSGHTVIQKELCLEAMRLCKLLLKHFDENQKLCALLSLMCFHAARFNARLDDHGAIILFEDQDRSLWNKELIKAGVGYLKKAMHAQGLSAYHIEAYIAAEHCLAENFDTTDWQSIYHQYQLLRKLKPNPIIDLNLAIIQSKLEGYEASLAALHRLAESQRLSHYHLLPATQGIFNMKLGHYESAISYLRKADKLTPSSIENNFIRDKIAMCEKLLGRS